MYITLFFTLLTLFIHPISAKPPECYFEIERTFLNPYYVIQAFSLNRIIYQGAWNGIVGQLNTNAKRIPMMVKQRASKMNPNPFNDPFQPKEAGEVFEKVVVEVLTMTLGPYEIVSPPQIQKIFNYVREQQQNKWNACFGEEESAKNH